MSGTLKPVRIRWSRRPSAEQATAWLNTVLDQARDRAWAGPALRDRVDERSWPNAEQIARYAPAFNALLSGPITLRRARVLDAVRAVCEQIARCPTCGQRRKGES